MVAPSQKFYVPNSLQGEHSHSFHKDIQMDNLFSEEMRAFVRALKTSNRPPRITCNDEYLVSGLCPVINCVEKYAALVNDDSDEVREETIRLKSLGYIIFRFNPTYHPNHSVGKFIAFLRG